MEDLKQKVKRDENLLVQVLDAKAIYGFKPNSEFYAKINIKRKRFAMLVRGEAEMTITEYRNVCDFFSVDVKQYIKNNY